MIDKIISWTLFIFGGAALTTLVGVLILILWTTFNSLYAIYAGNDALEKFIVTSFIILWIIFTIVVKHLLYNEDEGD